MIEGIKKVKKYRMETAKKLFTYLILSLAPTESVFRFRHEKHLGNDSRSLKALMG